MDKRIWAAWLLGVLVLAGCGGGHDAVLPQPQGAVATTALGAPQAATAPPGAQITPAQLMDWAEKTYPALFPAAGKTDGTSAPYTYRYYPATRNYIGVSTGAAAVDIYLYGEISGWSIARVGALADFICTVSPDACEIRRLSVSQFGSGGIQMAGGQAFCAADLRDCTREYAMNASVALTAAPASGWRLHHWSGCDTVAGANCTVAVGADRTVHPVFERTTPLTLKPDVVQLQSTTMSQLVSNQGGVLIFGNAASQIATLTAGKVIYSTVGEGLLRRVTSVISLAGGSYIVDTTDASLADLIAQGTLILDGRTGSPQHASLPPQFAGAQADLALTDAQGDGLSGKLALDLQPELSWDFDAQGITEFKFAVNPNLALSELQFRLKEGLFNRSKSYPFTPPTPFVVGPVVVTLTGEIEAALTASIKVGVELNGQMNAAGALGTHYLRSTGWRGIGDVTLAGSFRPGPQRAHASGELDGSVGVKAGLKLYGTAGPALVIGGFVKAEASDTVSAEEACLRWTVTGGLRAKAQGEVALLAYTLAKYEANLLEISKKLFDDSAGLCEDKEAPTTPLGLVASALSPTQVGLTWQRATDKVGVTEYALLRDGRGIGKVGATSYIDTHVQPDTEYCYTVAALDKAGNRSPDSAAACVRTPPRDTQPPGTTDGLTATPLSTTSIQLSWTAAAGGAAGYVVAQDGRIVAQVGVPATGTRVVRLRPGTRYCFVVAAIDGAGNFGAVSAPACATTLTAAAWTMKIKCDVQSDYVVENDVDLDVANDSSVSVVGNAIDYGGTPMAYQLFGTYSTSAATLSGRINWTFAGSSSVRLDEFDVRFASADTGDVTMRQVQVTGCTADIRFIRKGTPARAPMAAAARPPSTGAALFQASE